MCEAVASAHRSLVIHRDIKPGNVLVDGDGRVCLLDFGIARLVDDVDRQRTATALRTLTPEYAAPEQFIGAPAATTMDVYGIGALLYRVLSGAGSRTPGAVRGAGPELAPSRALLRNAVVPDAERQQRARALRGDLDVIVMKALATAPEARYASVEALADDLKRWLDGRPVRAQAPSWRYRTVKFVARNRLAMTASAALVLVLMAGIGGILWQANIARAEATRAKLAAEQSQAQLGYLSSVLDVLAPATAATRELDRRQVIDEAARRARTELVARPVLLASVEMSLGNVAQRIGYYPQAANLFTSALARRRQVFGADSGEVGEVLASLGAVTAQGNPPNPKRAEAQLAEGVALLRRHRPASSELVKALYSWAERLGVLSRYEDARASLAEAAALCANRKLKIERCDEVWATQGDLAIRLQHHAEAIESLQRVLALRRQRDGEMHAGTVYTYSMLGAAYHLSGDVPRGIAMLEQARRLQQRIYPNPNTETLNTLQDLAVATSDAEQNARALTLHQEYLDDAQALFGARSAQVALGLANLGSVYLKEARYSEAADAYRRAYDLYNALFGAGTGSTMISLGHYADALGELGQRHQAMQLMRQALAGHRALYAGPSARTASVLAKLGKLQLEQGQRRDALASYDEAMTLYAGLQENRSASQCATRSQRSRVLQALEQGPLAETEARAALVEIETGLGREHRCYLQGLAALTEVACWNGANDCSALRQQVTTVLQRANVPARTRAQLKHAIGERAIDKPIAAR